MKKDKVDEQLDDKSGTLYGETQLLEDPCDYEPTQLYGETQVLDDPVGPGFTEVLEDPVDTAIETQLVEDMGDWIETQVVEHEEGEEAEEGKTGCENGLCEADCGAGNCKEREEKQRLGGKCEEKECLVDSDASTDDEGCGSGIIQRRLASLRVASVRSSARAASRNFYSKSNISAVNNTSKSPNFLSKCTTLYNPLVREKIDSETASGANQAKDKTVRQLFSDVALETERVCSGSTDPLSKESVPVLRYVESQEPGILSQENALELVDKLIASHDMSPTPVEGRNVEDFNNHKSAARLPRTSAQTGTIQLAKNMGPTSLAKKAGIFDWDDVKEDETGGDFFAKKKDLLYDRKKSQSQPPKGKERENARGLGHSDSRLILQPRDKVSYENIRKNLFNETENEGAVHVMDNVGPDTQIAVEAIHALVHGSPVRPGSSKGMEIVGEIERERISNDGRNKSIASTKGVEETKERVRTRGRKKLMPDADKLVNNAMKRKVPTKNQSVIPEKVRGGTQKAGLDIFSDWASIPRRARSSNGTDLLGKTATPPKNSGQNASCGKKRVFIRSATELLDKAKRRRKVSLSDKEKTSMPSMEICKGSPVFAPKNSQKKALDGGSYRPSVQKEMLRLEMGESSVVRKWKDLRVRRDLTDARVLLSHHLDEKVIRQQRKILDRLGIPEAFSMLDGTHFVADQFVRTRNLLEAMARGKPIVTPAWLERCNLSNQFVDEKDFILRDAKKEKEMRFSMPNSLATACYSPLLKGKRVLITPSIKPSLEVVRNLVIACGGTPMERIVSSLIKGKVRDDLLLVSCEEDYQTCRPLLEKGVNAYCSELILNGIVIQKLEFERHRLFSDCVKRTRSTVWLRDKEGGKSPESYQIRKL